MEAPRPGWKGGLQGAGTGHEEELRRGVYEMRCSFSLCFSSPDSILIDTELNNFSLS